MTLAMAAESISMTTPGAISTDTRSASMDTIVPKTPAVVMTACPGASEATSADWAFRRFEDGRIIRSQNAAAMAAKGMSSTSVMEDLSHNWGRF